MFIVNLSKGTAVEQYATKSGEIMNRNYVIFLDEKGSYILTREKKIYLTEENSLFIQEGKYENSKY